MLQITKFNLPDKLLALSPMDGVTDVAYREIFKIYGNVDLIYTEFQNVHGLSYAIENLFNHLRYTEFQRPILAQIYGHEVEYFFVGAMIGYLLGFDGVDINMGCPAKSISDRGAGAGLIRTPEVAKNIIQEVNRARQIYYDIISEIESGHINSITELSLFLQKIEPYPKTTDSKTIINSWKDIKVNWDKVLNMCIIKIKEWEVSSILNRFSDSNLHIDYPTKNLTVSLKTRIGYDSKILAEWLEHLSSQDLDFLAVHGRTLKQMYTGKADWDEINRGFIHIKNLHPNLKMLANGDIKSKIDAIECLRITSADGLLIGRGSYGDPILFSNIKQDKNIVVSNEYLKNIILHHCKLHEIYKPNRFFEMRKNMVWYISSIPQAVDIRKELVLANNISEVELILNKYL